MRLARRQALAIFGRALLWLPLCLAAWHFASPPLAWIGGTLARPAVHAAGERVTAMGLEGSVVRYSVQLVQPYQRGRVPQRAGIDVEVKARLYTFGLPLFLSLALAARESRRVAAIAAGSAVLAVVPAWGIAFDALQQLSAAAELRAFIAWPPWAREAIALGYQVGSLLLPTLVPIALWLASARGLWAVPGPDTAAAPPPPPPQSVR